MTERHLHATVSLRGVLCTPDNDALVLRRASDGGWELPGGRLNADDEDVTDGLRREVREETGLDPTVHEPVHAVTWRNDADEDRFAVYYHCSVDDRSVTISDEHTASAWVPITTVGDRLSDPQATAVDRVVDRLAEK